ncbi:MAG: hypothetical protein HQM12_22180 [SAR324 cluster bacterium]|nr:hypothetical protein [SAR324 cluster bacterium]
MNIHTETPIDRLKQVFEDLGMKQGAFSESLGLHRSSVAQVISRNELKESFANKIEVVHGIRKEWLLFGELPMRKDHVSQLEPFKRMLFEMVPQFRMERIIESAWVESVVDGLGKRKQRFFQYVNRSDLSGKLSGSDFEKLMNQYSMQSSEGEKVVQGIVGRLKNLKAENLKQVLVIPLIMSFHFLENWDELKERSPEWQKVVDFNLEETFFSEKQALREELYKLDELFKLTPEQELSLD